MSLRQLRKLELQQGASTEGCKKNSQVDAISSGASSDSSVGVDRETGRRSVFLQAVGSDFQVSEAGSDGEQAARHQADDAVDVSSPDRSHSMQENSGSLPQRTARGRRKRQAKSAAAATPEDKCRSTAGSVPEAEADVTYASPSLAEASNDSGYSSCLDMERSAFDPEVDLRRMFGRDVLRNARISGRGAFGELKRLFLLCSTVYILRRLRVFDISTRACLLWFASPLVCRTSSLEAALASSARREHAAGESLCPNGGFRRSSDKKHGVFSSIYRRIRPPPACFLCRATQP